MRGTCHLRLLQLRVIGKENKKTKEDSFYSCIITAEKTSLSRLTISRFRQLLIMMLFQVLRSKNQIQSKIESFHKTKKIPTHTSFLVAIF